MAMRRLPRTLRTLPGTDALLLQKVFLVIFLGMVVVILALSMATAAADGAQAQGVPSCAEFRNALCLDKRVHNTCSGLCLRMYCSTSERIRYTPVEPGNSTFCR